MNSTTKPKIFFGSRPIAPPWDEGSKNVVYWLAQNLEDFNSVLLTYRDPPPFSYSKNMTLKPIFPKSGFMVVSLRQKAAFFWSLLTTKADIYHFYFTPEFLTARILRWIKRIKRGIFIQTIPTPFKSTGYPDRYLFGDVIVVSTQYTHEKLIELGYHSTVHIYPGINANHFNPKPSDNPLQKVLKLDPGKVVVLYPGNYHLGCNEDMIKVVQQFLKTQKNVTFIFACRIPHKRDEKFKSEMQDALSKEIASGNLLMLDSVEQMPRLLALADMIIFPPRKMIMKSEIPIVLLEALALEKSIIITNVPPLNEIMKQDVGEIVPPGDSEALVDALQKLTNNPKTRKEKGARGRNMVLKEFNILKTAQDYSALYKKVLEGAHNSKEKGCV